MVFCSFEAIHTFFKQSVICEALGENDFLFSKSSVRPTSQHSLLSLANYMDQQANWPRRSSTSLYVNSCFHCFQLSCHIFLLGCLSIADVSALCQPAPVFPIKLGAVS